MSCGTGIAQCVLWLGYGSGRWTEESEFDSRHVREIFILPQSIHTGGGGHPASYSVRIGRLSPVLNVPGHEADYLPSLSPWRYTSILTCACTARCLIKQRDKFMFTFWSALAGILYRSGIFST